MGVMKSIFKAGFISTSLAIGVLILSIILSPPPTTVDPTGFSLPSGIRFEGALEGNDELSKAEKLYEDQLVGAESFASFQADLYTGTADGLILKFRYGSPLKVIAHIGDDQGCRYHNQRWRLSECGRPLGLRFDSKGNLFVLDAYHGIKRVDIRTGFVELVCEVNSLLEQLEGQKKDFIFIDDFVLDEVVKNNQTNHIFYISEASTKWPVEFVSHVVLDYADKNGRLLNCSTSLTSSSMAKIEIIDSNLGLPNGLEMVPTKDAFLVNELNERRILKYFIRGPKTGSKEVLTVNLPGFPDNIKLSSRSVASSDEEAYWVALYEGFDYHNVNPMYKLLTYCPSLAKHGLSALYNLGLLIQRTGDKYSNSYLQQLGYEIKSTILYQKLTKSYGLIVKINAEGDIIKSLHSPKGVIQHISEVFEVKEGGKSVIYIGSYFNNYVGRLVID